MRPLPRVHAVTDHDVLQNPDFGIRLAAIAAAGHGVALHARDRTATDRELETVSRRIAAHARAPGAAVFVNARPDIARAVHADGLQLGSGDLSAGDARLIFEKGRIGVSVHSLEHAIQAKDEGADFLMVGSIFPTKSHPSRPAAGLELVEATARLGLPVIAIGGMTAERITPVQGAGAYGVAAIGALWHVADSAAAIVRFLEHWTDG